MPFPPPVLAALAAALVPLAVSAGPAADTRAAVSADEQATNRPIGSEAQGRQLAWAGVPEGVSVTADTDGYRVYATPVCTGLVWGCASLVVPVGGDPKYTPRVDTTRGYRISWPSGWKEGETRSVGTVYSTAKDWIAWWYAPRGGVSLGEVTRPYAPRGITAKVTSKDDTAKTANVSGTATPGAVIKLNGSQVATVDGSGNWSYQLTGLSVGANTRTFKQYVGGTYKDEQAVSVTIAEQVVADQITGDTGSATLVRGGSETVFVTYTPKRAFGTPTGSLVVEAPEGTTFAAGQDSQRGQYFDGATSTWRDFGGDSLVGGTRSADGTAYTFTLGDRNWDVAKDQKFRFGFRVDTPEDITTLDSAMTGKLTGSFPGATFATTATTSTNVPAEDPKWEFTGTAAFDDDVTEPVRISGTGIPGATVTLREGGQPIVDVTVSDPGGEWTTTIAAPDRGGVRTIEAVQTLGGEEPETISIPVDYGRAVRITSPGDGFTIPPAFPAVRISGTAEPNARVRLAIDGAADGDLGTVVAGADGRWAITTRPLEQEEQVIVATAVSKGDNTTTSRVTLQPQS